jgi:hypothetical protein
MILSPAIEYELMRFLIQRGGGIGPVKPRQPSASMNDAMVPTPTDPQRDLEDESMMEVKKPLQPVYNR